uniref:AP-3 complex subunit mu-1 n=1 Tax=Sinocyclocheilus rhinocerous TaxID=307959 RepID=A0A673MH86_9TELE
MQDYFGECSETTIKDNVVIVYELLEEMLDNGFPLATESNILKELIRPPTILRSMVNTITGSSNVGETLPTGQLSNIPWRRAGVKYTNNEAYFDVVEEIDAILDKSGKNILVLIFSLISQLDCSRQCINAMFQELQFLQKSGQLSNIPWRRAGVKYTNNEAYFDVVEEIDGTYNYDPVTKILLWDIGKLNPQKLPNLKGSLSLQSGAPKPEENPSLNIDLKIQQLAISGLKVNRLDMYGEKYKPFKGVKYVTKAGKFQVRT